MRWRLPVNFHGGLRKRKAIPGHGWDTRRYQHSVSTPGSVAALDLKRHNGSLSRQNKRDNGEAGNSTVSTE